MTTNFPRTPMLGTESRASAFVTSPTSQEAELRATSFPTSPKAQQVIPFTLEELDRQRAEIDEARRSRQSNWVASAQMEAALTVPGVIRARLLIAEAYRHELRRVRECRKLGFISADQERAAVTDVSTGYGSIIQEVVQTMKMKAQQGASTGDLQMLAGQAIQRMASLYPWSDSILTDLTPMDAVALSSRRHARRGETGKMVPLSLGATPVCSQAKNADSSDSKHQILAAAEENRERWLREQHAAAAAAAASNSSQSLSPSSSASIEGHDEDQSDNEESLSLEDVTVSCDHRCEVEDDGLTEIALPSSDDDEEMATDKVDRRSPMGLRQECTVFA